MNLTRTALYMVVRTAMLLHSLVYETMFSGKLEELFE